jgi:hypothetical protein
MPGKPVVFALTVGLMAVACAAPRAELPMTATEFATPRSHASTWSVHLEAARPTKPQGNSTARGAAQRGRRCCEQQAPSVSGSSSSAAAGRVVP